MNTIDSKLLEKLITNGVGVEPSDEETLILKSVPVHPKYFNKEKTNVLIHYYKRFKQHIVFVDENLEFTGKRRDISILFKNNKTKTGWRPVELDLHSMKTTTEVIRQIMDTLWVKQSHPIVSEKPDSATDVDSSEHDLLDEYSINLSKKAATDELPPTIGRDKKIELIIATLNKWDHPKIPVIIGESGVGRTNLIYGVANKFVSIDSKMSLYLLNLPDLLSGHIFSGERETSLKNIFQESLKSNMVAVLEDMDQIVIASNLGARLLQNAFDQGIKIIGTIQKEYQDVFSKSILQRRLQFIPLSEPDVGETFAIVKGVKPFLEKHYDIQIVDEALRFSIKYSGNMSGKNPAKSIHLIDLACSRATLTKVKLVGADDVVAAYNIAVENRKKDLRMNAGHEVLL